jgi:outer membrane protein assembly factor BamB
MFIPGDAGDELHILALDLEGRILWRATNGAAWITPYPGARASCAYSGGRLFHLNAHGRVVCLDPADGRELWAVALFEQFGGKNITWGLGECLLVDGPRVIVTPGGSRALMAALNARDGTTVWASPPLRLGPSDPPAMQRVAEPAGEVDKASYASPILLQVGPRRLLVTCSLRHAVGVDALTGALLWTRPLPTRHEVIAAAPVLCGDALFFTAPDAGGGRLYGLLPDGMITTEPRWTTPIDTCHGGLVYRGGMLYGSWYRARRGWAAIDVRDGSIRLATREPIMGSVLYADGRLYWLSQEGEALLVEPGPEEFRVRGRFTLVSERVNDAWAHPVIHGGRLHLRYHDALHAYDIRAVSKVGRDSAEPRPPSRS